MQDSTVLTVRVSILSLASEYPPYDPAYYHSDHQQEIPSQIRDSRFDAQLEIYDKGKRKTCIGLLLPSNLESELSPECHIPFYTDIPALTHKHTG